MKIQRYRHELEVSYALGATLTYELLNCAPESATRVFVSPSADMDGSGGIRRLLGRCQELGIPVEEGDKAFHVLSPKGNCFVIGEFKKTEKRISPGSHLVLVNPSDAGNLGTILRTAAGFGIEDIAVIRPGVDCYDPKVVRASMGAVFHVAVEYFQRIEEYRERFPENSLYAFMLSASTPLTETERREPCSLVFGNEATGLPDAYRDFCRPVVIRHSRNIDSLSLPMAAGIAMYEFTKDRWKGGGQS